MEVKPLNSRLLPFSWENFLGSLYFLRVINWVIEFSKSSFLKKKVQNLQKSSGTKEPTMYKDALFNDLIKEDVEIVMNKLGIIHSEYGKIKDLDLNLNEISLLFEENEPSMDEVMSAFAVFDENGDGFIDSKELQKVLCNLGLTEGLEENACKTMIQIYDENRDGHIDFQEFLKVLEHSL